MKVFLFLCVSALAMSAGAWGELSNYYGRVNQRGYNYTCTFRNNTGHALSMRYVVFNIDRLSGDDYGRNVRKRIDTVVYAGKTISRTMRIVGPYRANYCYFSSR